MNSYEDVLEVVRLYGGIIEVIGNDQIRYVCNYMHGNNLELTTVFVNLGEIQYVRRLDKWVKIDLANTIEMNKIEIIKNLYLNKISYNGVHIALTG